MEEVWGAIQHGMVDVLVGKQLPTWVWNGTWIKGISTQPLDPYPIRIPDTHTHTSAPPKSYEKSPI